MEADGGNLKQFTTDPAPDYVSAWSPDGKRIALVHYEERGGSGTLWVVSVADGVQSQLGPAGSFMGGRPAWKPVR